MKKKLLASLILPRTHSACDYLFESTVIMNLYFSSPCRSNASQSNEDSDNDA